MAHSVCRWPAGDRDDDRWSSIWRHHDELLALARPRVVSDSDAEDVVHEALALAAAETNLELERAGAWLNRVVRNRCADMARERSYADKRVVYEKGLARAQQLTEDVVCDTVEAVYLSRRLHELPTRQHEALLHASEGLSNAQIAAAMSTTVKAIESLLVKARRALRTAAAASLVGLGFLGRRRPRGAVSAPALVALGVGLSMCIVQAPSTRVPSRAPSPVMAIQVERTSQQGTDRKTTRSQPHAGMRGAHAAAKSPVSVAAHPRKDTVDFRVGPSHTHLDYRQYGKVTNPVPDVIACVRGGVVVSKHYVGCRVSPGSPDTN